MLCKYWFLHYSRSAVSGLASDHDLSEGVYLELVNHLQRVLRKLPSFYLWPILSISFAFGFLRFILAGVLGNNLGDKIIDWIISLPILNLYGKLLRNIILLRFFDLKAQAAGA